jgi:hypothetical protein
VLFLLKDKKKRKVRFRLIKIFLPNKLVDANGVDVSVLGCVVVELNKNPLPLRV